MVAIVAEETRLAGYFDLPSAHFPRHRIFPTRSLFRFDCSQYCESIRIMSLVHLDFRAPDDSAASNPIDCRRRSEPGIRGRSSLDLRPGRLGPVVHANHRLHLPRERETYQQHHHYHHYHPLREYSQWGERNAM